MSQKLSWGIIGTGTIARAFASALATSRTGELVAVGSRAQATAGQFGKQFRVPRCYGSYEALLADPGVQAVYISTPHIHHAQWAIRAAQAGKHILCEKPLALNAIDAGMVIDTAREHDVFLMEAFMYRCHPQTTKLVELLRAGVIGEVRIIQATFSYAMPFDPDSRVFNQALAGGGILDVGCYCTSMARLVAGVATGEMYAEPIDVSAVGHIGARSRVDEYTVATARFPGDILAELATGVTVSQENVVRIFGTNGSITLPAPWVPAREGGVCAILLHKPGESAPREISITTDAWLYAIEADTVAEHLKARQAPCMTWEDTLGNMRMLDRWRAAIGLVYDAERATGACRIEATPA